MDLPSTIVFDYPTPSDIASFIAQHRETQLCASIKNKSQDMIEVQQVVARLIAEGTGQLIDAIPLNSPLSSLGVDSLTAIDLRDTISAYFKIDLPGTLVFDYPTVISISKLVTSLAEETPFPVTQLSDRTGNQGRVVWEREPIALSNLHHRLAKSPTSALPADNIMEDTSRIVPWSRWDVDSLSEHVPKRLGARFGRFLSNIEWFDTEIFNCAPLEAIYMDPQQRIMLESAYEALKGIHGDPNVGVLASISFWDYSLQADRHIGRLGEAYKATGRCFSVAAGRISYCYGLKGPSASIDTACSSSLSAMHLGKSMLHERRCGTTLVTAALLTVDPSTIWMLTGASMLTPDGRCKTLDARADGYARGEACVTMALGLCESVGSDCNAIILGSAINQDGRSSSLTAPNGPSQQSVISS